jgi:hypothetical protein
MVHVDQLSAERVTAAARHHDIYKAIWQDVEARIKSANSAGGSCLQYRLSPFHVISLAQPLVSCQRAARYVRDKLVRNGFTVLAQDLGTTGVLIHISWQSTASADLLLMRNTSFSAPSNSLPAQTAPPQPSRASVADLCLDQLAKRGA